MIRIAIVDDDDYICSQIEKYIMKYNENSIFNFDVSIYNTGEGIYSSCENGEIFDIIFLDIELYQMNGIEVGLLIRNKMKNNATQIIYISGQSGYAEKLFKVRPLDFLRKPISYEDVSAMLSLYIELYGKGTLYFKFCSDRIEHRIQIENIIYFASRGKKIIVKTPYDEWEFYGKLDNLQNESFSSGFISIHKSYYVNLLHIVDHQYKKVRLTNGEELKISQNKAKEVRQKLLDINTK
jgi:hypothetical protein CLOSPO_01725